MENTYKIARNTVQQSMLAVVISDAARDGEFQFQRCKFGTVASELLRLSAWLTEQGVQEVVMESTAQYWKPVWQQLEGQCELYLAQAHSNRAPRGRKRDFADAERLLRRHVAGELILSFVPDPEQRLWRTMTRTKHQLTRDRVRIHNQLESLLEDARIKLSGCVSDLLGVSGRRMLAALAEGETDAARLAAMADPNLRATPERLQDALHAAATLSALHRQILSLFLARLQLIENQMEILDTSIGKAQESEEGLVIRVRRSKTDQEGQGREVALPYRLVSGNLSGAGLPRVDRGGRSRRRTAVPAHRPARTCEPARAAPGFDRRDRQARRPGGRSRSQTLCRAQLASRILHPIL